MLVEAHKLTDQASNSSVFENKDFVLREHSNNSMHQHSQPKTKSMEENHQIDDKDASYMTKIKSYRTKQVKHKLSV